MQIHWEGFSNGKYVPLEQDCRGIVLSDGSALDQMQPSKAWDPKSAATFCGQPHKEASAQGHNNNSNNEASKVVAGRGYYVGLSPKSQ